MAGVVVWPGGVCGQEGCMAGGCALRGACMVGTRMAGGGMHDRGACMPGGPCVAGEMVTAAGGKHPTGMHSCCGSFYC